MSTIDGIANAGKSFACGLYSNIPGALVGNPISDVLKLVWDGLCGDPPGDLPPPPTTPFSGGQCVCVAYDVVLRFDSGFEAGVVAYGPIGGARIRFQQVGPNDYLGINELWCRGLVSRFGPPCLPTLGWVEIGRNPGQSLNATLSVVSATRVDGNPDLCGNPNPAYPTVPTTPPGGYTSPPTAITYNDGTDFNVTFNLQPPKDSDPPGPPDICLKVKVKLVEFEVCFPPDALPRLGGEDGGDVDPKLDELKRLIDELQRDVDNINDKLDEQFDPPDPENDPDLTPDPLPGDEGGEQDAPGIKWLVVSLTTLPQKSQFGSPTVFFAGWVTFKVGDAYTERQQINFQRSVFRCPDGSTGYGVTFTNFSKGEVIAYTQQQQTT